MGYERLDYLGWVGFVAMSWVQLDLVIWVGFGELGRMGWVR